MRSMRQRQPFYRLVAIWALLASSCNAFVVRNERISSHVIRSSRRFMTQDDSKFGFGQRIESLKCLVLGAISGSVAMVPFSAFHDLVVLPSNIQTNGLAQWEFDNDMAGFESGLFAIVYRYCIRQDDNEQLNQGVIGAFLVTRTLSRIIVPPYCSAIVLNCGPPLGYVDWSMIGQLLVNGAESAALFGATAAAMDWAMTKGYISKFPGWNYTVL